MSVLSGLAMIGAKSIRPPSTLLNDLGGYWKLDGNSNDSLGVSNGVDGTVSYVTGKISQGVTGLTGWAVSLGINAQIKPTAAITVAGWFKWTSFQANARALSDWHQSGVADRWILTLENGAGGDVEVIVGNLNEVSVVVLHLGTGLAGNVLVTGTWYHLAFTYDGSTVRAYRDGVQVDSASLSGVMNGGGPAVRIGTQAEAGNTMDGIVDEVGIWSRALTGAEMTELYNSGTGVQYPF